MGGLSAWWGEAALSAWMSSMVREWDAAAAAAAARPGAWRKYCRQLRPCPAPYPTPPRSPARPQRAEGLPVRFHVSVPTEEILEVLQSTLVQVGWGQHLGWGVQGDWTSCGWWCAGRRDGGRRAAVAVS